MNSIKQLPVNEWNDIETPGESRIEASTLLYLTRDMVRSRTLQLAINAGRGAHQIKQSDYEQAKREMTGESDFDRQQAILDARRF